MSLIIPTPLTFFQRESTFQIIYLPGGGGGMNIQNKEILTVGMQRGFRYHQATMTDEELGELFLDPDNNLLRKWAGAVRDHNMVHNANPRSEMGREIKEAALRSTDDQLPAMKRGHQ
ncbi:hypothetical protein HY949_04745 [Candidatus Gottesmanbacteria bacterium]|nr:hypothetical protein [Candidatus Gottesmanbacteria bacterium]